MFRWKYFLFDGYTTLQFLKENLNFNCHIFFLKMTWQFFKTILNHCAYRESISRNLTHDFKQFLQPARQLGSLCNSTNLCVFVRGRLYVRLNIHKCVHMCVWGQQHMLQLAMRGLFLTSCLRDKLAGHVVRKRPVKSLTVSPKESVDHYRFSSLRYVRTSVTL